jgi:hypothetical protein
MAFADLPKTRTGVSRQWGHNCDRVCAANGIQGFEMANAVRSVCHAWTNDPSSFKIACVASFTV